MRFKEGDRVHLGYTGGGGGRRLLVGTVVVREDGVLGVAWDSGRTYFHYDDDDWGKISPALPRGESHEAVAEFLLERW